jgi:hypothetical protein
VRSPTFFTIMLLSVVLIFGGCSDKGTESNGGPPADNIVGPEGGTVEVTGEVTLSIPAGALGDSVEFTVEENDTPDPVGGTKDFASPVFTIGPPGTDFDSAAILTINYSESALGGGSESSVQVYTDDGSGWEALTTVVDTNNNTASAEILHLSDFGVVVDTTSPAEGVYTILVVARSITHLMGQQYLSVDLITARFDSAYAPCVPILPLQPDSVSCNQYTLEWDPSVPYYKYQNLLNPAFLDYSETYTFDIAGNAQVLSLTASIDFLDCGPHVTNITAYDTLSLSGFEVQWDDTSGGLIQFVMTTSQDTTSLVTVETSNDGSYTFTESDLDDLAEGYYALLLFYQNTVLISADGYDPRSHLWAYVLNSTLIYLE